VGGDEMVVRFKQRKKLVGDKTHLIESEFNRPIEELVATMDKAGFSQPLPYPVQCMILGNGTKVQNIHHWRKRMGLESPKYCPKLTREQWIERLRLKR
jgi:hypothetical protein